MCRLVIGTPGSHRITHVAAAKLDLCIVAHSGGEMNALLYLEGGTEYLNVSQVSPETDDKAAEEKKRNKDR
jgi:hypothetical protein